MTKLKTVNGKTKEDSNKVRTARPLVESLSIAKKILETEEEHARELVESIPRGERGIEAHDGSLFQSRYSKEKNSIPRLEELEQLVSEALAEHEENKPEITELKETVSRTIAIVQRRLSNAYSQLHTCIYMQTRNAPEMGLALTDSIDDIQAKAHNILSRLREAIKND